MKGILITISILSLSFAVAQKRVGINQNSPKYTLDIKGNVGVDSSLFIGHKIHINEALNASVGEAQLINGIAQVFPNKIGINSKVFLSYKKPNFSTAETCVMFVPKDQIIDKVSFVIKSELNYPEPFNIINENDNSIVYWWVIN
jgi:hypothetical protein